MAINKAQIEVIVDAAEKGFNLAIANIHYRDKEGRTPLHYAAAQGRVVAITALVEAGARLEVGTQLDARDINGCRPIHHAVRNNRIGAVRALAKKGANLTAQDINGQTALDYAKERGHLYMVFILRSFMDGNVSNEPSEALKILYLATHRFYSLLWEEGIPRENQGKYIAFLNAALENALGFVCAEIKPPETVLMSDELTEVYSLIFRVAHSLRGMVPQPAFYDTLTGNDFDTVYWRYATIRGEVEKKMKERERASENTVIKNTKPMPVLNNEQCRQLEALQKAMRTLEAMLSGLTQEQQSVAYAIVNEALSDKLGFNYVGRGSVPTNIKLPSQVLSVLEEIAKNAEPLRNQVSKPQWYITNIIDDYVSSIWRYTIVLKQVEAQLESNGYVVEDQKKRNIFFDEKDHVNCSTKILPDAGLEEIVDDSFEEERILREQDAAEKEKTITEAEEELSRLHARFEKSKSALAALTPTRSLSSGLGGSSAHFRLPSSELHCDVTSSTPILSISAGIESKEEKKLFTLGTRTSD